MNKRERSRLFHIVSLPLIWDPFNIVFFVRDSRFENGMCLNDLFELIVVSEAYDC